eukprot:5473888-Amphidinium_carterae.1
MKVTAVPGSQDPHTVLNYTFLAISIDNITFHPVPPTTRHSLLAIDKKHFYVNHYLDEQPRSPATFPSLSRYRTPLYRSTPPSSVGYHKLAQRNPNTALRVRHTDVGPLIRRSCGELGIQPVAVSRAVLVFLGFGVFARSALEPTLPRYNRTAYTHAYAFVMPSAGLAMTVFQRMSMCTA